MLQLGVLQEAQDRLLPKLGGVPWGLPLSRWPVCRQCGSPMALLAQLPHAPPAVDLGEEGNVLHLFQCTSDNVCDTWEFDTGSNAAFVLKACQLMDCLVAPPRPIELNGELWITGWTPVEDGIPASQLKNYLDRDSYWAMTDEEQTPRGFDSREETKSGGIPYWTGNGPPRLPDPPFEYMMQFDTFLFVRGRLPDPKDVGCHVTVNHPTRGDERHPPLDSRRPHSPKCVQQDVVHEDEYYVTWANFGSDGTAYVFINREVNPPDVLWFWNR
jgi:hypothetical protein